MFIYEFWLLVKGFEIMCDVVENGFYFRMSYYVVGVDELFESGVNIRLISSDGEFF